MSFKPELFVRFFAATLATALPAGRAAAKAIGTFMPDGDVAEAPLGFEDMCLRDAALCDVGLARPATITAQSAVTRPGAGKVYDTTEIRALSVGFQAGCITSSLPVAAGVGTWRPVLQPLLVNPKDAFAAPLPVVTLGSFTPCVRTAVSPVAKEAIGPKLQKKMVDRINAIVNNDITQISDFDATGVEERWQRPEPGRNPVGDCEDLAIEKRMRLIDGGFPSDRLFLAVAYRRSFGLHTVLVARLDDGDRVLDSMTRRVLPWAKVKYVWLRKQTIGAPRVWRRIGTPTHDNDEMVLKKASPVIVASS